MITNKHISKIILVLMVLAVALCFAAMIFSDKLSDLLGYSGVSVAYEEELFNTDEIITVDILMDEEDWNNMLKNAMSEEYYSCDVVVNGTKFTSVGIRPKGNTSLSSIVADETTDRYSLKLEFDHYVEGQTCFGLDKLILNNNYADATNMKEAIIYDMYQYLDVDASLYNYAKISVNGEYWGVYLALEAVEDSFMLRNYGTQDGELYKPESMGMGGNDNDGNGGGFATPPGDSDFDPSNVDMSNFNPGNMDMSDFNPGNTDTSSSQGMAPWADGTQETSKSNEGATTDSSSSATGDGTNSADSGDGTKPSGFGGGPNSTDSGDGTKPSGFGGGPRPSGDFDSSQVPSGFNKGGMDFGNKGGSMGGGGSDLNYTDDDLDSYSVIWDGAVTNTSKKDHRRVVTALENISKGNELEKYLDVDNVLKYMAVHVFAVNMDSLSGNMSHNYYLYEYNGQLNILPWDYNLSFGGMTMGASDGASGMINDAIDTPFAGTDFFNALLENEEYLAKYHEYLRILCEEYVGGGEFEKTYQRITGQIDSLVETDPTAFYSNEEYEAAKEMLYKTILLRTESILGQLDGTIPSTDEGQRQAQDSLIDASEIDVTVMGQFNMGRFTGGNEDSDSDSEKSE